MEFLKGVARGLVGLIVLNIVLLPLMVLGPLFYLALPTAAPCGSVTWPAISPVVGDWASARLAQITRAQAAKPRDLNLVCILIVCSFSKNFVRIYHGRFSVLSARSLRSRS
jgi:hypothetical protein